MRHEVDRALALVADPGAAGDVHRFQLSMKRKQDLFVRMRDLDITWNDWLAEAEGVDSRLRASNITSRIYPFLPQPLPRGLNIIWRALRRYPSLCDHANLRRFVTLALSILHYMEKSPVEQFVYTAEMDTPRDSARTHMSSAVSTQLGVTSPSTIQDSECLALLELFIPLDQNHTIALTLRESDISTKHCAERSSLERGLCHVHVTRDEEQKTTRL
ncbi:hypothetical protein EDB87DRAFT_1692935 [Lactarius vividus]|nr:hypothetical protein EDB87DRAFT_1692935 [Lactarius vividus]